MSVKTLVTIGIIVGSSIGGYLPSSWGDFSFFSLTSIFFSFLGGIVGAYCGYKLSEYLS